MLTSDTADRPPARPGAGPSPAVQRELLAALTADGVSHGRLMATSVHERIPELGAVPEQRALFAETEASCSANVTEILRLLESGLPIAEVQVPDAARDYAVGLVHRRIPLAVLLRAYRVGQNHLWTTFAERLRTYRGDDPATVGAMEAIAALLFEYVDRVSDELAEIYQRERDQWVRSASAVRVETVRELLDGGAIDSGVASQRLVYELRGRHVALIVSADPSPEQMPTPGALERAAATAAAVAGCRDPLLVPVGTSVLWAWASIGDQPDGAVVERLEAHRPDGGLRLAIGRPGAGVEGFRVSHEEAQHAAELYAGEAGPTVSYRSLELLSLLTADFERSRRFVRRELGPLAATDGATARLRETALAFLDHGGSHLGAAQALHLHKNTVYTRVRRAERALGTPVVPGRAALHAALTLAVAMPARVIAEAGADG
ncbi:helix-turn-helix domain-containing protein [Patulibacter sp. NPDC049589]|uniref:PucR family transcriptional regulator n=1 Tax=Patulibacter sp. NPDC049589 TaxID=3154731 RepID=UPI00341F09F2